jgi:hypothetical protein
MMDDLSAEWRVNRIAGVNLGRDQAHSRTTMKAQCGGSPMKALHACQRQRLGDAHVSAPLSRFIPDAVVDRFER